MAKLSLKDELLDRKTKIFGQHTAKTTHHPVWHTALAFYEGQHWKRWNKDLKGLRDVRPKFTKRKMTVNKIQMVVTTMVAHYMKEMPRTQVNPNSNTPEDMNSADMGGTILKVEFIPKFEAICGEYLYWKYIIGTVIYGEFFDPNASADGVITDYDPEHNEYFQHRGEVEKAGQIYLRAINPFNFYPVGGPEVRDCREILYVEYLPISEIKTRFEFDADPDGPAATGVARGYARDEEENKFEDFEERAKVFQYWRRDDTKRKKGIWAVMCNDKVVEVDANKYSEYPNKFPFHKSCAIPVPGRFFGRCPVEQLRRLQIAYNYSFTVIVEMLDRAGKQQWWLQKGTQIAKTGLNSNIGSINYYAAQPGQAAPTQVPAPPIPAYFFNFLGILDKAFEDVSGFHEVKSARLPTGANNPSGVMVNLLLEQDETRLTPAVKAYLRAVKEGARMYLQMVQEFYSERRVIKIAGDEKEPQFQDFEGAELRNNNDVEVELAPMFSDSRAAWAQDLKEALAAGAIDHRTYLTKMRLEHPKALESILVEEKLALRENTEMRHGAERQVEKFHKDEIHMPIHEDFMKTRTFENLDPQIQDIYHQHRDLHMKQQAEKFKQKMEEERQLMEAQNPQMMEPGGPPAGGGNGGQPEQPV